MDINEAYEMAHSTMVEQFPNLVGWRVEMNYRAKGRLGQCHYGKKALIFSALFIPHLTRDEFQNTVLHEVAHALTRGHQHDAVWRRKFIALGGNGKTVSDNTVPDHILRKMMKYEVLCVNTGKSFGFINRMGKRFANGDYRCPCCKTPVEIVQLH